MTTANSSSDFVMSTLYPDVLYQNCSPLLSNVSTAICDNLTTEAPSSSVELEDILTFKVAKAINKYYLLFVCSLGIPGNLACILTLTSMTPLMSSSVYMLGLAIVDTFALAFKMVYVQVSTYDVRLGDQACQLIFLFGTVTQQYSNWILVALTIERFIAIWFPLKVCSVCTRKKACMVLVGLLVFLTLANLQFVFTFEEVTDPVFVYDCVPKEDYKEFILKVWYWIDGLLYGILPIFCIILFNGLIISAIRRRGSAHKQLHVQHTADTNRGQQRQITMMLITISVAFVVLVLPNCLFFIVKEYWNWKASVETTGLYYLIFQIVFVLSDLNHALNFYLYCVSGRKFRQKFVEVICCKRHRNEGRSRRSFYGSHATTVTCKNDRMSSQSCSDVTSVSRIVLSSEKVKCDVDNTCEHI